MNEDGLDALAEVDRQNRIGRSQTQVGLPGAVVVIGAWLLRLFDIDLNPAADSRDMPPEVVAAFIVISAALLVRSMNRKPPAEPSPATDVVEAAAAVAGPTPPPNVDPANPRH